MAQLQDILYKVSIRSVHGDLGVNVNSLQTDSRMAGPGSLFIALKGTHTDSHQFIGQVVEAGAIAVVCETLPATLKEGVTYVQVENSAAAAGYIAHNFYGQPSEKMKLVGVTGTNGKTTIATYVIQALYRPGIQMRSAEHRRKSYRRPDRSGHAYNPRRHQPECLAEGDAG